jgi:hypothetical protein
MAAATLARAEGSIDERAETFYRQSMQALTESGVPFLLGGAYALAVYTGVVRHTKDIDIFLRRQDLDAARAALEAKGWRTELTYPHWLAKVFADDLFVDLIFNLGNGASPVDDTWLHHAVETEVLRQTVRVLCPEDMIWSKLFTLDRGRFDGADIAHLIRACGRRLDWQRLIDRAGRHWRVLLSHLVLFGYVYPAERDKVPAGVLSELVGRMIVETEAAPPVGLVCQGTLLSPTQYLIDVAQWGYRDGRLPPFGTMTPEQIEQWTAGVLAGK